MTGATVTLGRYRVQIERVLPADIEAQGIERLLIAQVVQVLEPASPKRRATTFFSGINTNLRHRSVTDRRLRRGRLAAQHVRDD